MAAMIAPAIIPVLSDKGRYSPIAMGKIGSLTKNSKSPITAPMNTKFMGMFPSITPWASKAINVPCGAGNAQGFAAAIALHDGSDFDGCRALVFHATQTQAALQTQGNFGLHIGQLFLYQLVGRQGLTKLLAV